MRPRQQGFLIGLSPALVVVIDTLVLPHASAPLPWLRESHCAAAGGLLALLHLGGAVASWWVPRIGRLVLTAALSTVATAAVLVRPTPLSLLLAFVLAVGFIAWLWDWTATRDLAERDSAAAALAQRANGAAWGAGAAAFVGLLAGLSSGWSYLAACAAPVAALAVVIPAVRAESRPLLTRGLYLTIVAALLLPFALWHHRVALVVLGLFICGAIGAWTRASAVRLARIDGGGLADTIFSSPARALVGTFFALIAAGTLLLVLPFAAAGARESIHLVDALFTSTSATCVTGLIVLDTPHDLSTFGQGVILTLIQIGGLGIMIFSVAALSLVGRRLSLRQEAAIIDVLGTEDRSRMVQAVRTVLSVTIAAELTGALVLTLLFLLAGDTLAAALWRGLFTSISAFCNAGFALQTQSLIPYQSNPAVLATIATLIVAGGLGPAVIVAFPAVLRRERTSLHVRLVLAASAALLLFSFLFILAAEWGSSLATLSRTDAVANALFQAVTLRTAGFNSIDIAAVRPATLTLMLGMMFIGGSPGSTAGGIKTTTFALLALMVRTALAGRAQVWASGFTVPQRSVYKAAAVATLAAVTSLMILGMLQLTQQLPSGEALFETVSAIGTVGLSIGGTEKLDSVGKIIIAVTMFAGRVGPLTLFMFLAARPRSDVAERPEEEIVVG